MYLYTAHIHPIIHAYAHTHKFTCTHPKTRTHTQTNSNHANTRKHTQTRTHKLAHTRSNSTQTHINKHNHTQTHTNNHAYTQMHKNIEIGGNLTYQTGCGRNSVWSSKQLSWVVKRKKRQELSLLKLTLRPSDDRNSESSRCDYFVCVCERQGREWNTSLSAPHVWNGQQDAGHQGVNA